jgi:hypothetical protein
MKCCATCANWKGDKDYAIKQFADNPISLDLDEGWARVGECSVSHRFVYTDVVGDAIVSLEFAAGFCCSCYRSEE